MFVQHDLRRSRMPTSARGSWWNAAKTAGLLAGLGAIFVYVGSLFGATGTLIGAIVGLSAVAGSWWFCDRLALRAARARPLRHRDAPGLAAVVKALAARAGIPAPSLWLIDDPQPNAFATGRDPDHGALAVTTGLLHTLPHDELEAVLAHEIGHIAHRDTLIVSVAAAVATAVSALANLAMWMPFFGYQDDEDANPIGLLLAALLAPIAATLVQLAISRTREYDADREAAHLLGNGHQLARALARIDRAARLRPMAIPPAQAAHFIINPLRGEGLNRLFSTHPATEDRIRRLLTST